MEEAASRVVRLLRPAAVDSSSMLELQSCLVYSFFDGFTNAPQANLPYPSDSNLDIKKKKP